MIEDPNQYEKLLQSAGKQKGKDGQKKEMGKFVDEEAERILSDLENESWFHGALPLEDIVGLITERGDFLLRSLEPEAGRGAMEPANVEWDLMGSDGAQTAILNGGQALLTRPIPKQSWELSRDKIKMESKLGEGTFGEVWKGTLRHFATDIQVAIKVVHSGLRISVSTPA
ncbi:unnamed protein product [Haemonchus placei]|uniref:Pkinase_Tyr domain-containing protein n=1 Tax=Haemonchus placei TaxID=6290 RepID=A0A0N4WEE4_HAEPC|nr:unnamed protein product [Haemonchus placei]